MSERRALHAAAPESARPQLAGIALTFDDARAITEFRATVSRYPRGNKVPDALLKIGFAYQALGETDKARAALEQVVALYPGSSPAAIAAARLEKP
jgi:TolA-binding protein